MVLDNVTAMTDNQKKKAPAKKAPAKKPSAKKPAKPKAEATKTGAQRGRPRKKIQDDLVRTVVSSDEFMNIVDKADDALDRVADSVIIRANDIKKKSLRERMLKWFKK